MIDQTFAGGDVGIATDIDIVEMSSSDYKLAGFHSLIYKGQKEICNIFNVKFINSKNCCKSEDALCNNLRDHFPSKTLHISGDGNYLFYSISYYMTGNIDNCNKIRTIIVDNVVGKLKEPCNKFIMNKFPRTVNNYRNVNDCVIKSKMRTNTTWSADVELCAVELLIQTDIWI